MIPFFGTLEADCYYTGPELNHILAITCPIIQAHIRRQT